MHYAPRHPLITELAELAIINHAVNLPTLSASLLQMQFLPQDRVVEFARMDSFELLQATQKAIGDAHLYDQHKQLIAKRAEAKTLETVSNQQHSSA